MATCYACPDCVESHDLRNGQWCTAHRAEVWTTSDWAPDCSHHGQGKPLPLLMAGTNRAAHRANARAEHRRGR